MIVANLQWGWIGAGLLVRALYLNTQLPVLTPYPPSPLPTLARAGRGSLIWPRDSAPGKPGKVEISVGAAITQGKSSERRRQTQRFD